jgi:flagellar biogenesis protein FliO
MAMQLSIDGGNRQRQIRSEEIIRGSAAVWILSRLRARLAVLTALVGRAAQTSIERMRSAQADGSKRKQMKLVESLALGNRRQLLLVVCDNQRYLVAAGADSVGSILAIDAVPVSRDRAARGPELVRRRVRETGQDARSRSGATPVAEPVAGPGLNLWH